MDGVCVFKTKSFDSDIGTICSCVALATFKVGTGSAKTGFLSISLSGVTEIEVEVATITAVLSAPAFGRELSIAFPSLFVESSSNADGFGTVSLSSSQVCMGDGDDDETDDLCSSQVCMGDGDDDETDDLCSSQVCMGDAFPSLFVESML